MNSPRLTLEHISKRFGGVQALRDVRLSADSGEVHALCGENGAGKSTLMKIVSGAITEYEGTIRLDGRPVRFGGPREAEAAGIRIIHQELNLVPELSASANIFLGREQTRRLGLLNDRAMHAEAGRLFERLGAAISPRAKVGDLRIGDQQMVEIAKALAAEAAVIIMDEPTSALSDHEVARLFRVIEDLRRRGACVLYISHKMNEVFTIADRVTVLRDGQYVATASTEEIGPAQVVRWMVGRDIQPAGFPSASAFGRAVLKVKGLNLPAEPGTGRPSLRDVGFEVRSREVLGVAGLLGAGRTELLEALFGAAPVLPSGDIVLEGRPVRFRHPRAAIGAGVAMVTEDRKSLGLFSEMNVGDNITIASLGQFTWHGDVVNPIAEREGIASQVSQLGIKAAGPRAQVTSLSGGNQQKCILGRWLLTRPKVLLLDEPTRGIDVGAKAEIYGLIRRLAGQGMAVLMTSSELPELLAVCDRILVLCEGRVTADLPRSEANEESIMQAATAFLDRRPTASG